MLAKKLESKLAGSLNVIIGEFVYFLVGFVVVVVVVVVVGILSFGRSNIGILKVRMGELVERLVVLNVVIIVVVVDVDGDDVVLVVVVVVTVVVIVVIGTDVVETLWFRNRGTLKFSMGE